MHRTALARRKVVHVGEGANIWSTIHIQDVVTLYLTVIKDALAQHGSASKVDAYSNFFFASSNEQSIKGITELIAPILYKKGEGSNSNILESLLTFAMREKALLIAPKLEALHRKRRSHSQCTSGIRLESSQRELRASAGHRRGQAWTRKLQETLMSS